MEGVSNSRRYELVLQHFLSPRKRVPRLRQRPLRWQPELQTVRPELLQPIKLYSGRTHVLPQLERRESPVTAKLPSCRTLSQIYLRTHVVPRKFGASRKALIH